MENFVYIYALEFPFGNIRYVGKSKNPNRRFKRHIQDARKYSKSHKLAWIRSLLNIGKLPFLYIIDKVPENEWEYWEQYYIRECELIGFRTIEKHSNAMLNKEKPDIMVIKRLTDNVIPAVYYNTTEIELLQQ